MSDDGSKDPYVLEYEEPTMELVIETLTGTTFEMTVSPTDNILTIKNKIQRVEGIPVTQQHLLYRLQELGNEVRLCDRGITAGSTLCLVLSMRGGPISTRRSVSTDHHLAWREIKDYIDTTREDMLDKVPPGSKVTVLLFHDGDTFNLIRVVENEDGTCYPFSESWPPQKNNTKESSQGKQSDRSSENNSLMRKVVELRQKMEGLSVQKKTRKVKTDCEDVDFDLEQPSTSTVSCDSTTNFHNVPVVKLHKDLNDIRAEKTLSEMYTDRLLLIEQRRRNNRSNIGRGHFPHRLDASISSLSKNEDISVPSRNCTTIQTPSIAILEEETETSLNKNEADLSPPSPISVSSGDANTVAMSQIPSLPGTSRNLLHLAHMAHVVVRNTPDRPKTSQEQCESSASEYCNLLFNKERCHNAIQSELTRRNSSEFPSNSKSNLPKIQSASTSRLNEKDCTQSNSLYGPSTSNLLTTSQYTGTFKLNNAHLDNVLGDRVSDTNSGRSAIYGRKARIERIRNNIVYDNYGYNNLGYNAKIERVQNSPAASVNKTLPPYYRSMLNLVTTLRNRTSEGNFELRPFKITKRKCDVQYNTQSNSKTPDETVAETDSLPALVPKKRTRCAMCNKRLNITTIHTCRCGGIFCSQHRYSEVHGCHYDYKTEGRKILEQANPLVAAPKLPKI